MKKVLITTNRYKEFEKFLDKNEYQIIPFPTIKTIPLEFEIESVHNYDFILFTSVNAVKFFFDKVKPEELKDKKIIAVGEKTAQKLKELGFDNVLIPEEFRAEGILKLIEENWNEFKNKSILIPRAKKGRELLSEHFKDKNIKIDVLPIYETIINIPENRKEVGKMLKNKKIETVIFTSPSTFENFLKIFDKQLLKNVKIAVIGKTTQNAIEKEGLKVDFVPKKFSFEELAKLIQK